MFLRQLSADGNPAVAERIEQVLQSLQQMVRSFVNDQRPGFIRETLENGLAFFFIGGKKSLEGKASGGKSGESERGNACACARKRGNGDACFVRHFYEFFAGVRDRGSSGIGDKSDILTFEKFRDKRSTLVEFIVLMIARHRSRYLEVVQKLNAVARIFGRDQVDFLQSAKNTEGYIFEIADRRRA